MDTTFNHGDRVRLNRGVLAQFEGHVVEIDHAKGMAMVEFRVFDRLTIAPIPLMRLELVWEPSVVA